MDARQTLDDFSRLTGLPVEADVSGLVSVNNEEGTVRDFLNGFAKKTRCIWWYDGFTIRLEPRANMRSVVIGTRGIDISTLSSTMDFVGLKENQFTTRMSPDGTLFNVVGPEGYVGAVEDLIDQIITARKSRREGLPSVYRGQFASNRNTAPATQPVTAQITSAPTER